MASNYHIVVGSHIWTYQTDDWEQGNVDAVNGNQVSVTLQSNGKKISCNLDQILPTNASEVEGCPNILSLEYLHDPGVMYNLKVRFLRDDIYTWAGKILIVLNPFKPLPIMGPDYIAKYHDCYLLSEDEEEVAPHVYAVADRAFGGMLNSGPQSTLISGESGAGKTEAAKAVLAYITKKGSLHGTGGNNLEQQIMASNPILEAFGNAKTSRNDNSSRFGKYIQVKFDNGKVSGADTTQYLLEKVRVVKQQEGERNYHVFYQFLAGMSDSQKAELKVGSPKDHYYLRQSSVTSIKGVNDRTEWEDVCGAWDSLGFSAAMQAAVTKVLAGILHLGDTNYSPTDTEGSKCSNPDKVQLAATLLGMDATLMLQGLTHRSITVGGNTMHKPLTPELAAVARDSLAKYIYGSLFIWTVQCINKQTVGSGAMSSSIGILDIFGFEIFQVNSFEQLCINFCNEKLQQHFNAFIFKSEQKDYEAEKIDVTKIVFEDNQDTLDLIEKKPTGILPVIDDVAKTPKADDMTLVERLHKTHESHPNYSKPKMSKDTFIIRHFAGEVTYSVNGFLDKNMDALNDDLRAVVKSCADPVIANILRDEAAEAIAAEAAKGGKKPSIPSIGQQFRSQLDTLMEKLNATDPHFIKCIKSCSAKQPGIWEHPLINRQLRFSGVLEATRIRRSGFPVRTKYAQFVERYYLLVPGATAKDEPRKLTEKILERSDKNNYAFGVTKIFLRDKEASSVEARRTAVRRAAILELQRLTRPLVNKERMNQMLAKGPILSRVARRCLAHRAYIQRLRNLSAEDAEILSQLSPPPPRPPTPPQFTGESPEEKAQKARALLDGHPHLLAMFGDEGPPDVETVGALLLAELENEQNTANEARKISEVLIKRGVSIPSGSGPLKMVQSILDQLDKLAAEHTSIVMDSMDNIKECEAKEIALQQALQDLERELDNKDANINELRAQIRQNSEGSAAEVRELKRQLEDAKAEIIIGERVHQKQMQRELDEHYELIEALDEELKLKEAELAAWNERHEASFASWQEERASVLAELNHLRERLHESESSIIQVEAENVELKESVLRFYDIAEKSKLAEMEARKQASMFHQSSGGGASGGGGLVSVGRSGIGVGVGTRAGSGGKLLMGPEVPFPMSVENHAHALNALEDARRHLEDKKVDLRMRIFNIIKIWNDKRRLKASHSAWRRLTAWSRRVHGRRFVMASQKKNNRMMRWFFFRWYRAVWSEENFEIRKTKRQTEMESEIIAAKEMWLGQLQELKRERESMAEQVRKLNQEISEKSREVESLQGQLAAALEQISRQESVMVETIEKANTRQDEIDRVATANKQHRERESAMQTEIAHLRNLVEKRDDTIENLRGDLEQRQLQLLRVKETCTDTENRLRNLVTIEDQYNSLLSEFHLLEHAFVAYQNRITSSSIHHGGYRQRVKILASTMQAWKHGLHMIRLNNRAIVFKEERMVREGLRQFRQQCRLRDYARLMKDRQRWITAATSSQELSREIQHKLTVMERESRLTTSAILEQQFLGNRVEQADHQNRQLSTRLTDSSNRLEEAETSIFYMQQKLDKARSENQTLKKAMGKFQRRYHEQSVVRMIQRKNRICKWETMHAWKRILVAASNRNIQVSHAIRRQEWKLLRRMLNNWSKAMRGVVGGGLPVSGGSSSRVLSPSPLKRVPLTTPTTTSSTASMLRPSTPPSLEKRNSNATPTKSVRSILGSSKR